MVANTKLNICDSKELCLATVINLFSLLFCNINFKTYLRVNDWLMDSNSIFEKQNFKL
jgi:putative effector of murein hydrolase